MQIVAPRAWSQAHIGMRSDREA